MKLKSLCLLLAIFPIVSFANCSIPKSGAVHGTTFYGSTICTGPADATTITVNGAMLTVSNTKMDQITATGNVVVMNASLNTASVGGNLTSTNGTLGNMNVAKDANLTNSTVNTLTVNGTARLNNVKINSITSSGKDTFIANGTKIYLSNNTVVSGNITFSNGSSNVVYVSTGAKVLGTVSGGQIQNQ